MMSTQIHPLSDVKANSIGTGTKIWQYCVVMPDAQIGIECNICANVLIENDVIIGNNVTVKSGVQLWNGVRIGHKVFIGPNVTFTNDIYPRSQERPERFLQTVVCDGVSIGANSTILPGIIIGAGAMIGAGTVVTRSVPPNAIVYGNPGRISGYTNAQQLMVAQNEKDDENNELGLIIQNDLEQVYIKKLPLFTDNRGSLSVGEFSRHIPFDPKRYFLVFNVPGKEVRGEHAHRVCEQFIICTSGSCSILIDDGKQRSEILLSSPNEGIYIPPMVWGVQYKYSADAVLLVFASHFYDNDDYIRDYNQFLDEVRSIK